MSKIAAPPPPKQLQQLQHVSIHHHFIERELAYIYFQAFCIHNNSNMLIPHILSSTLYQKQNKTKEHKTTQDNKRPGTDRHDNEEVCFPGVCTR